MRARVKSEADVEIRKVNICEPGAQWAGPLNRGFGARGLGLGSISRWKGERDDRYMIEREL